MLNKYPVVDYSFSDGIRREIANFTVSILIEKMNLTSDVIFKPLVIREGDTAEIVSNFIYGNPSFWWTVLLVNEAINPFNSWLRKREEIEYANKGINDLLFFIDTRTNRIVDDIMFEEMKKLRDEGKLLPEYINPVYRNEYDLDKNEVMRKIWVISPDFIHTFVQLYEDLLRENDIENKNI